MAKNIKIAEYSDLAGKYFKKYLKIELGKKM